MHRALLLQLLKHKDFPKQLLAGRAPKQDSAQGRDRQDRHNPS